MTFLPPERFNLADYLLDERVRESRGERVALRLADRELTYRNVQALADRFARVLAKLGALPEQRVLLALPDGPEYVGALFGILKLGAVVVMINRDLSVPEIVRMYEYTRARYAVIDHAVLANFAEAKAAAETSPLFLTVGGSTAPHPSFEEEVPRVDGKFPERPHPPRRPGDLALLGRHHRPAEGGGADPHLLRQHHRVLRQGVPRLQRERDHPLGSPSSTSATRREPTSSFPFPSAARPSSSRKSPPRRSSSPRSAPIAPRSSSTCRR